MTLGLLIQLVANGLALGMLYLLIVLGVDLILRGTKILNFAQGQFYMLGAYTFFLFYGLLRLNWILAFFCAAFAIMLLGFISYISIFNIVQRRFIPGMPFLYRLLISAMASIGLMMILQQGTLLVFGTAERGMRSIFPQMISIADIRIPLERIVIILLVLLTCLGLYLLMYKTRLGRAMRAVAFDAEVSSLLGVNPSVIYLTSFMLGCGLAGIAGATVAPVFSVTPTMGTHIILTSFMVMVVGGIGSYKGAILGGIIVGLASSFGYQFLGGFAQSLIFVLVIVLIVFRPGGLLGEVLD